MKHLSRSLFLAVWYEFEQRDGKSFLLTCVSALARLRERTGLSHKRVWPCRVYVSLSVKHDSCFQTYWERWKDKRRERENWGVCWIHSILLAGAHTTCSKIPITNTLYSYQSFTMIWCFSNNNKHEAVLFKMYCSYALYYAKFLLRISFFNKDFFFLYYDIWSCISLTIWLNDAQKIK